ncbi:ACT domain-containing protein [Pseudoalteromonas sp. KJ10-2]|uniref:ACT domain-containing protein n=1 Tax=Psychromonas sp. KJ10-2 TaxID=3391822 RepID=UPI0039B58625
MSNQILLTITGEYHVNLVNMLSEKTHALEGKWLNSKINHIDNQMAGLIKVELDPQHLKQLIDDIKQLGLTVTWMELPPIVEEQVRRFNLSIDAKDRLGLVKDISAVLNDYDLQLQNMECNRIGVPDIGGTVFTSHFHISTVTPLIRMSY